MAKSIWDEIPEVVKRGEHPVISIPPGARVIIPKVKRPRGRPRTRIPGYRYAHYAIPSMTWEPVTCRARGCRVKLKAKTTRIVCSDACEARLREYCVTMLEFLDGKRPVGDLPQKYKKEHCGAAIAKAKREEAKRASEKRRGRQAA